ncbi:hypothetical protein BDQ17DRAFT_1433636 [Cyathus striatus]|nr:hypothetical protein BDQ17DRAFT_1433636 [Cyathus striatus]
MSASVPQSLLHFVLQVMSALCASPVPLSPSSSFTRMFFICLPSPPCLSSDENACIPPPRHLLALPHALSLSVPHPSLPHPPLTPSLVSSLPCLPLAPFPCPHLASDEGARFLQFPSPPLPLPSSASDEGQCLLPCSSLSLPLQLALISQVTGACVPSPMPLPLSASDKGEHPLPLHP